MSQRLMLLLFLTSYMVLCAVSFQFGYLSGSSVKNRDLELTYQDGFTNCAFANPKSKVDVLRLK